MEMCIRDSFLADYFTLSNKKENQIGGIHYFYSDKKDVYKRQAIDELKEKATYITSDADDDGIYNACKYFGWID